MSSTHITTKELPLYYPDIPPDMFALPGYNSAYTPIYYNQWSTHEEHGWIFITQKDNQYYTAEGGVCVMTSNTPDIFDPIPISEDEAIKLILEWDNEENLPSID